MTYEKRLELITKLTDIKLQKTNLENKLRAIDGVIGVSLIDKVYQYIKDRKDVTTETTPYVLTSFKFNDQDYTLVIDFVNNYDVGQCFSIDQFENKLLIEQYESLKACANMFEEILLGNAIKMFDKLNDIQKRTYRELDRLIPNRRRNYTYYYRGKDNKKFMIGFVIVTNF